MVLQVHDELLFELPRAELNAVREIALRLMPSIELAVPLELDEKLLGGPGARWSEPPRGGSRCGARGACLSCPRSRRSAATSSRTSSAARSSARASARAASGWLSRTRRASSSASWRGGASRSSGGTASTCSRALDDGRSWVLHPAHDGAAAAAWRRRRERALRAGRASTSTTAARCASRTRASSGRGTWSTSPGRRCHASGPTRCRRRSRRSGCARRWGGAACRSRPRCSISAWRQASATSTPTRLSGSPASIRARPANSIGPRTGAAAARGGAAGVTRGPRRPGQLLRLLPRRLRGPRLAPPAGARLSPRGRAVRAGAPAAAGRSRGCASAVARRITARAASGGDAA